MKYRADIDGLRAPAVVPVGRRLAIAFGKKLARAGDVSN
jgi:hypothetical protein